MSEIVNTQEKWPYKNFGLLVFALHAAWPLALILDGRLLNRIARSNNLSLETLMLLVCISVSVGMIPSALFVKTFRAVKRVIIFASIGVILTSLVYLFPSARAMVIAICISAMLFGLVFASWVVYAKELSSGSRRIRRLLLGLISINVLVILLSVPAKLVSIESMVWIAILFSMVTLVFAFGLPETPDLEANEPCPELTDEKEIKAQRCLLRTLFAMMFIFTAMISIMTSISLFITLPPAYDSRKMFEFLCLITYLFVLVLLYRVKRDINRVYLHYFGLFLLGSSIILHQMLRIDPLIVVLVMLSYGIFTVFWIEAISRLIDLTKHPGPLFSASLFANIGGLIAGLLIAQSIQAKVPYGEELLSLCFGILCLSLLFLPRLQTYLFSQYILDDEDMVPKHALERSAPMPEMLRNSSLTTREREVAMLLLEFGTYKNVGAKLSISENTVKFYARNIFTKMQVRNRDQFVDLVLDAIEAEKRA